MRIFKIVAAVALLALGSGSAHAALGHFSITGITVNADLGNPFGLDVGDAIYANADFDASGFTGVGEEIISFGAGSGNSLHFTVGALGFEAANDIDFFEAFCENGLLCPTITFVDGEFQSFNYIAIEGVNGAVADFSANLGWSGGGFGWDDLFKEVDGVWDLESAKLTIPEPGSLALLGMGLAGIGFARRRKSA